MKKKAEALFPFWPGLAGLACCLFSGLGVGWARGVRFSVGMAGGDGRTSELFSVVPKPAWPLERKGTWGALGGERTRLAGGVRVCLSRRRTGRCRARG